MVLALIKCLLLFDCLVEKFCSDCYCMYFMGVKVIILSSTSASTSGRSEFLTPFGSNNRVGCYGTNLILTFESCKSMSYCHGTIEKLQNFPLM